MAKNPSLEFLGESSAKSGAEQAGVAGFVGSLLNPKGACLFLGVAFFQVEGNAFEPEAERFPVDEKDDFEGDEGECECEPGEVGGGQLGSLAGECAKKNFFFAAIVVDGDAEAVAG